MSESTQPSDDEKRAAGAEAVLLEWLRAVRGMVLADRAALRAWAVRDPAAFRAAFATFIGIDTADLAPLDAAAGWLLGANVRPDDVIQWTGDPADPWLAGRFVTGATLTNDSAKATRVLEGPVAWPPRPLRPPASGPDGG